MKIKTIAKVLAFVLLFTMMLPTLIACGGGGGGGGGQTKKYDTEKDPLVMSTLELDGVFNPFYSTTGTDNGVWGMTSVAMFDTDEQGNAVWGGDRPCLALDYQSEVVYGNNTQTVTNETYTDYTYVLKPNAKFSNGSSISVKDVLFYYYVNLDPVYTGANTMYSADILGLHEYRTQTQYNPDGNDASSESAFNRRFEEEAQSRADNLVQAVYDVLTDYYQTTTPQDRISYNASTGEYTLTSSIYDKLASEFQKDYKDVAVRFYKELETDYNSALSTDLSPSDKGVYPYPNITDPRQYFLYIEGYIETDKEGNAEPDAFNLQKALEMTREELIQMVFQDKMPGSYKEPKETTSYYQILNYWVTGNDMKTQWAAEAKGEYLTQDKSVDHIYGITWNKQFQDTGVDSVTEEAYLKPSGYNDGGTPDNPDDDTVTVNGNVYPLAKYDGAGNLISGFEVINIRIKKVDPKAVWSFAGSVTPMYYYSSATEITKWDGYNNFGVSYANTNFYDNNVKSKNVPVGAGTYMATTATAGESLNYNTFYSNNVVYYERNPYFYTMFCNADGTVGPQSNNAKIKYVRYQVVNTQQILNNLVTGAIDYADPNATRSNIDKVDAQKDLDYTLVDNLGYGYIGINAGKAGLESVYVRRALMTAMDTTLVLNYYQGGLAENIWFPMSKVSWAYPKEKVVNASNFRYAFDKTGAASKELLNEAISNDGQYSWSADNKFCYQGSQLKLTFTIAGSTDDHPAYNTMQVAAEVLNSIGLKVEVKNDSNTLKKLSNGELQVWAAAWGSAIDPDMFQTYHVDSNATSPLNWGYREIKRNPSKYSYETDLIDTLSEKIDLARETLVQAERKSLYAECLDLVLELAVELPTYQRKNMFVYNTAKIDVSTLVPEAECTAYQSPMSFLWKVDYNK